MRNIVTSFISADEVALAVGISIGVASVILLSVLIITGCLIWIYKQWTKENVNLARYIIAYKINVEMRQVYCF